jgi:hypothetical protein
MRTFLFMCIFCAATISLAQSSQPFDYLKKITVQPFDDGSLYYNSGELVNSKRGDLPSDHPFYAEECEGESSSIVAFVTFSASQELAICYGFCPGPSFYIYDNKNPDLYLGHINAQTLYIPGNGFIYASGGEGSFDAKRKYQILENEIVEIKQPFYYVGLKSTTLKPITIYQTKELKKKIAGLPVEYPIEVMLAERDFTSTDDLYLVKTSFGLVGWARLKAGQYTEIDVKGLIYRGD